MRIKSLNKINLECISGAGKDVWGRTVLGRARTCRLYFTFLGQPPSPGSCVILFPKSTLVYSRNSQSYENAHFIRFVLKLIIITINTSVWKAMK